MALPSELPGTVKNQMENWIYSSSADKRCRGCGSGDVIVTWSLSPSPYGDLFRLAESEARELEKIGLTLALCSSCQLLQLLEEVDTNVIYSGYLYQTGVTVGLPAFYARLAGQLASSLGMKEGDLVVDVGSNDGSGLTAFRELGMAVLGIEPASGPAKSAEKQGIPTIVAFLSRGLCEEVAQKYGRAKLVSANAVLANVPDPVTFLRNLGEIVDESGFISIVTGYHPDEFAVNMFDYINHDHLSYFSVASMLQLSRRAGLKLISASRVEHKGGSIHFLLTSDRNSGIAADESIEKLLQREEWLGANLPEIVVSMTHRIDRVKQEIGRLIELSGEDQIGGVGASISTTHLLHQFDIGDRIATLYDEDVRKIGRYSPGFGIEVRDLSKAVERNGGVLLLLSWQHTSALLKRLEILGFKGSVVVPLPEPRVIKVG